MPKITYNSIKMKNKNLLIVIAFVAGSFSSFAQSNLLNAKKPAEIGVKSPGQLISDNDKPLAYGYVHDRDVLMGKTTWEIIDLDERINFPLYYPIDTANIGKDRRSLYDVQSSLSKIDTTDAGREQFNAGIPIDPQYIVKTDLGAIDVSQYKIKGYWYFDSRQSELKYRLLGICPVTPDVYTIGKEEQDYIELFWIYYPAARDFLHAAKAFNDKNSAMPIAFDQLFNSRHFNAVVYQEENVYGDRMINDYVKDNAQMELLESARVKEKIRDFEHDMWAY